MSPSQPESGSNDGLPTYVQMLVGFEAVPEWHNLLSTYFILQLTTGFITIPPAFVTLSTDGTSFRLTLNKPLFANGIWMISVGLIGMFVLSRYRSRNRMALKNNHFWLYHRYYQRVAESGLYGLISLLVTIFEFRKGKMDRLIIAALSVTCFLKAMFSGLASWSYVKTRQARKAYETLQSEKPQSEEPQDGGLSLYVQMLVSFQAVPGWHTLLSTLFIEMITTGFITIFPSLITVVESNSQPTPARNKYTKLALQFLQSEPLFAIAVSIFFVGLIGMLVLSCYRGRSQIALKNNHFWLYHRYYQRVAEAGLYGLISLLENTYLLGTNTKDAPTIAVICVTCVVTALFSVLTGWEYLKTRHARMEHFKTQLQADEPQTEEASA